jgi:pimeloyl-ACP methyl ester carboxylesterase
MKFVRVFFAATLLGLLPAGLASPQDAGRAPLPAKENFHLFLLLGQSNMAGRGKIAAEDQTPHPRVFTFRKEGRWAPATDPLHFDKPGVVGVGLGRTFGLELAEANPEITVGLIPCAAGGSPISSWAPGGYHTQTKSHPYDDALRRARVALKFGELKGILWHQGESDAQPDLAEVYEEKLHALIARLRSDLGAPNAPFIAGQMGQFPERPWSDAKKQVDAAHRALPQKVADTAFVSAEGLTHKGDEVHFSAESYRELGRRYAKAYLSAAKDNPSSRA